MRRILLNNTMNTRDLGGYPVSLQESTRYDQFWRSDFPSSLTTQEVNFFLEKNITTIVDLRSEDEIEKNPSFFTNNSNFSYFHCPLFGGGAAPSNEKEIPASYMNMLFDHAIILKIMKIFANYPTGILYHCTAGKDRTGVISALLLSLAGVSELDILADYQISYTYISPKIYQLHLSDSTLPQWVGKSKIEYLAQFLSNFKDKYLSAENYLLSIGLFVEEISRIKSKLLFI